MCISRVAALLSCRLIGFLGASGKLPTNPKEFITKPRLRNPKRLAEVAKSKTHKQLLLRCHRNHSVAAILNTLDCFSLAVGGQRGSKERKEVYSVATSNNGKFWYVPQPF